MVMGTIAGAGTVVLAAVVVTGGVATGGVATGGVVAGGAVTGGAATGGVVTVVAAAGVGATGVVCTGVVVALLLGVPALVLTGCDDWTYADSVSDVAAASLRATAAAVVLTEAVLVEVATLPEPA